MRYYPLLLDMSAAKCLLVGAGEVGCRKLTDLLSTDVESVLVLDIQQPSEKFSALLKDSRVSFECRPFEEKDVIGMRLVFSAASHGACSAAVLSACKKHGIPCNIADTPDKSDFIVPARVCRGKITAAISTQGGSPALATRLRQELETYIEQKFAALAEVLTRLRPIVLALQKDSKQNAELFRSIVYSPLGEALGRRDRQRCEALLQTLLPPQMHSHIGELLYELC